MDWKLEVVCVPVSNIDRAKAFYSEQAGFKIDYDSTLGDWNAFVFFSDPDGNGWVMQESPAS